jgi:hypothetical protein
MTNLPGTSINARKLISRRYEAPSLHLDPDHPPLLPADATQEVSILRRFDREIAMRGKPRITPGVTFGETVGNQ